MVIKEQYIEQIIQQLELCSDLVLLDLIVNLLRESVQ